VKKARAPGAGNGAAGAETGVRHAAAGPAMEQSGDVRGGGRRHPDPGCLLCRRLGEKWRAWRRFTYFIALDVWLFLTVLFANFATALAEARGKAQADSLRRARHDTWPIAECGGSH
jgi:hypothetical protein